MLRLRRLRAQTGRADTTAETAEETAEPAEEEAAIAEEGEMITLGMMKIVSHPALDSIQAAFLDTLAEGGYVEGENLTIIDGNAEGDIATLTTIAQQFVDEEVDLIATTSTPALQAAFNVTKDMAQPIPIIFNAVTSPWAAGVAEGPDDHHLSGCLVPRSSHRSQPPLTPSKRPSRTQR